MNTYFSFQGRISRSVYWLHYMLPITVANLIALGLDELAQTNGIILGLASLLTLIPSFAANAKRCHDRGRSGWFMLVNFIPFVGGIWYFIETGFLRGVEGWNKYGSNASRGVDVEVFR